MKLSYIFHSGFVLETEQSILVFDFWLDPCGVMDNVLQSEKPMYVFSSHFHEDHFTKEIFERFKVGLFVPMHFTTGFESSWRMKEFTDEKNITFWEINREGETIGI